MTEQVSDRWLDGSELRIGLGCMRMSTEQDRDESLARETIAAAVAAGVTVFDTARAYGQADNELGHNERLLADALLACGGERTSRVITKGAMTRAGGAWIPDGRAKAILDDCEASQAALAGLAIDLYLIHAPDPRRPWRRTVRALTRLLDEGAVKHVGLSNVTRRQLDEAVELAPISAVQVALSIFDDGALRGGVVERCVELGIALIAHSPLGGPRRAAALARNEGLARVAANHGVTPAEIALAWLLDLSPTVVAIPGARRPETARSAARAGKLALDADDRAAIRSASPSARPAPRRRRALRAAVEVVLAMGIPGAGKSQLAKEYETSGYLCLNRDERGGKLRGIAEALDGELSAGVDHVVLDNTYLTRAARSYIVEVADRYAATTRCIWLDVPLAQAQINLVERMLVRFGSLPAPEALRPRARRESGLLLPTSQMRCLRELEPPSIDEGFAAVERRPFTRTPQRRRTHTAVFVAAAVLRSPGWQQLVEQADPPAPHLIFDWIPDSAADALDPFLAALESEVAGPVEGARCPHGGGPPRCWCRPPLPGLPLAFAHRYDVDPERSILIGTTPTHRTLATSLGARYVAAGG
jgi:aryl-alcohol dehydrogenase-like predicted oxidoreductase/adenylate kinase family enzyme